MNLLQQFDLLFVNKIWVSRIYTVNKIWVSRIYPVNKIWVSRIYPGFILQDLSRIYTEVCPEKCINIMFMIESTRR